MSSSFEILQSRMMRFLGVAVAYAAAMFVAFAVLFAVAAAGGAIFGFLIGGLVLLVVSVIAGAVAACAYIHIAQESATEVGDDPVASTIATLRRAWLSAPRLILALLVLAGFWIALTIVAGLLSRILGPLGLLVDLAVLVAGIWLGVSLSLVPQTAVIDRADPVGALRDSVDLVSGHWWRTAGYWLVAAAISLALSLVGLIVIAIVRLALSPLPILGILVGSLVYSVMVAAIYAFYVTYGTLMFYDLKARNAGMAQEASAAPGL